MKTIAVKELRENCERIAVLELPELAQQAFIYQLKSCGDIKSFFVVLESESKKRIWEDIKLLTHLQLKKFQSSGEFGAERFLLDMTKQYSSTVDCRFEIESVLLRAVKSFIKSSWDPGQKKDRIEAVIFLVVLPNWIFFDVSKYRI